jgi:hypothetical protein
MSPAEQYLKRLFDLLGDGTVQNMMREYITEECGIERERCAKIAENLDVDEEGISTTRNAYAAVEEAKACIAAKIRSGK